MADSVACWNSSLSYCYTDLCPVLGRHSETSVFCLGLSLMFADPALNSRAMFWPNLPRILPSGWSLCHLIIAQVWEGGPGAALEPHSKCDSTGPERSMGLRSMGEWSWSSHGGFGNGLQVQGLVSVTSPFLS